MRPLRPVHFILLLGHYEVIKNGTQVKTLSYFMVAGQRIAMREGSQTGKTGLYWLLTDHLGSTNVTVDANTNQISSHRLYRPWGEDRFSSGPTATTFGFTGQRQEPVLGGIYYYNARWYDPYLSRWLQPDTIVPAPYHPLDWDRYSYVRSNPINYVDPTGHFTDEAIQDYLKKKFGKQWEETWKKWLKDKDWMKLLHDAKAGDVLSTISYDLYGTPALTNYTIMGKDDQELYGLSGENAPSLNSVLISSDGIGVARVKDNNISIIGTIGNISYNIKTVDKIEAGANAGVYYGGLSALAFINTPMAWICAFVGTSSSVHQATSPDAWMGFYEGDTILSVSTFNHKVGGLTTEGTRTTFRYTFRRTADGLITNLAEVTTTIDSYGRRQ